MKDSPITKKAAEEWLLEAAKYFENMPSNGEDMTYWANASNANTARRIADLIRGVK
jgi:hypothetical protein